MGTWSEIEAADGPPSAEPEVFARLFLMTVDADTGAQTLVGSFVRRLAIPPALVRADMKVALDVAGERRVFEPTGILWDETQQVCFVEIVWVVADEPIPLEAPASEASWMA